jgi:hypothetical protein
MDNVGLQLAEVQKSKATVSFLDLDTGKDVPIKNKYEALELIYVMGINYDGCVSVKELQGLVNEMMAVALLGMELKE